jgi:hypothetical protein
MRDPVRLSGPPAGQDPMCGCPLHTLFPQRIADLIEPTRDDLVAACDLIGNDSYGKPHWTPETISPCNPVVQAFARHAARTRAAYKPENTDG